MSRTLFSIANVRIFWYKKFNDILYVFQPDKFKLVIFLSPSRPIKSKKRLAD